MRFWISLFLFASTTLSAMTKTELDALVSLIDDRQRNTGDYEAKVFILQTEDKIQKAFEAQVYRRDEDKKWMILFTQPKSEAGRGYLRMNKNLFLYEPSLGKWERKTERASIVGTGSQRSDFDGSKLKEEFIAEFIADETLGPKKIPVHHIMLTAKPNVEVGYPVQDLWVDVQTKNILKRQDSGLSKPKKIMRTVYYPFWEKRYSKSKKAEVYVPQEIHIFDNLIETNKTLVKIQEVSFEPLPPNIFTKSWMESKSK